MEKGTCFYCEKNDVLDALMIHIYEFNGSDLYLNRNQSHLGRVIIASKSHVTEIFQLSKHERECFINNISLTSKALQTVFYPDKINYAIFGDIVSHLHMHLVPKYKDKKNWGMPYNDEAPVYLSNHEYAQLITKIRNEIKKQLNQ